MPPHPLCIWGVVWVMVPNPDRQGHFGQTFFYAKGDNFFSTDLYKYLHRYANKWQGGRAYMPSLPWGKKGKKILLIKKLNKD